MIEPMSTPSTSLSEQAIIEAISDVLNPNHTNDSQAFNASDDAYFDTAKNLILTTDMLVEGTHFKLNWPTLELSQTQAWEALGWKAVALNLSDIAAMGGQPTHLQVGLGISNATSKAFITAFYTGMQSCANRYHAIITGGDTVRSPQLTISITATGILPEGHTLGRRSGACAGDWVLSTGYETTTQGEASPYGMSGGGLITLNQDLKGFAELTKKHRYPTPRIEAGLALSKHCRRYALMDTSDGLADACLKIAKASDVAIEINAAALPTHPELHRLAQTQKSDPAEVSRFIQNLMLYGGEEFELMACVPADTDLKSLQQTGFKVIGRVLSEDETTADNRQKAWLSHDTTNSSSPKTTKTELQHDQTFQH